MTQLGSVLRGSPGSSLPRPRPATASAHRSAPRPPTGGSVRPASALVGGSQKNRATPALSATGSQRRRDVVPKFLCDADEPEAVLPRPLPPGMAYVATYTPFEELVSKQILTQSAQDKVHLSVTEVAELYRAKCKDQGLQPSKKRECRYIQLLSQNCKGMHFSLRENGLGFHSAECIATILAENEHFAVLDLSGNRLKDLGAIKIAELLMVNDALVHVALKSNDIGAVGAEKIAEALEANTTVTSLDVSGLSGINRNHLGAIGARAMGQALSVNQTLAILNLGANGLGNEGLHLIALGLDGNTTLTELDLGSNNLGWESCSELGHLLSHRSAIQSLNLERNDIRDKGLSVLAQALKASEGISDVLEVLNLSHNNVREPGFRHLAGIVKSQRALRTLRLDGNECGEACADIAIAIRDSRSLQHVTLCRCDLGPGLGLYVADALASQSTLTRLELQDNLLRDDGASVIVAALKTNSVLKHLDLGNNKIGDVGGNNIASMLQTNRHLQYLSIRQNYIKLGGDRIAEALRVNGTLLDLEFSYNDFSFKAYLAVGNYLQKNVKHWKKQATPRLLTQIDSLKVDEATLHGTQEEIVQEIKRREVTQENLSQKKEHIKHQVEQFDHNLKELEERCQEMSLRRSKGDEHMAVRGEELQREKQRLENIRRKVETKIKSEEEKVNRMRRDFTKVEKELEGANERNEKDLAPFRQGLQEAMIARDKAEDAAKKLAEDLAKTELRVKELQRKAKVGGAQGPPPPSGGVGVQKSPRQPAGSDNRRGPKKRKSVS